MVEEARQLFGWCIENELYDEAMVCLHRADHLQPGIRGTLDQSLVTLLRKQIKQLEELEKWDKIALSFRKAFNLFPNCSVVHHELGRFLQRTGNLLSAISEFKEALRLNSSNWDTKLCLENAKSQAVDQWHFRMLNDKNRNLCYQSVINEELENGNCLSVLDIGTGTGILSMMAAQHCISVYACESSSVMFKICEDVLQANNMTNRITVHNKSSLHLKIPEDIPDKVSLVITEVFDAGLLGEGALTTLKHAWDNLLFPPTPMLNGNHPLGKVIPKSSTIFVSLVECEWLRKCHQLVTNHFGQIDFSGVKIDLETNEPYNSEHLKHLPGGYKLLNKPIPLCSINFNSPDELNSFILGQKYDKEITCAESGFVDCVALWFDLELSRNVTINTGPESDSCWEQAIFPITDRLRVRPNDIVQLSMVVQEPIKLVSLSMKETQQTGESGIPHITLTSEWIQKLNNSNLASCLQDSLYREICQGNCHVLDHQQIPLAALIALKMNGAKCIISNKNIADKFLELCSCLNLPSDNVSFLDIDDLYEASDTYDVMFYDPLQQSGIFNENILRNVVLLKENLLNENGRVYPESICVYGVAVDCPLFNSYWKVRDENVLNFKIADVMNDFQTQYQEDINFHPHAWTCLTDELILINLNAQDNFSTRNATCFTDITKTGYLNSFLYWSLLSYGGNCTLDTHSSGAAYSVAAFSPIQEMDLKANDKLKISCTFSSSIPQFQIEHVHS